MDTFDRTWFASRLRTAAALLAATLALAAPAAADAATGPDGRGTGVSITEVDSSRFPTVRVGFGADEHDGRLPVLSFTENGRPIRSTALYRGAVGRFEDRTGADLMLVLDTSLSMKGDRIDAAKSAAHELIAQANPDDRIGLTTFGGDAKVVIEPTTSHELVLDAVDDVQLANRTTLFDGVKLAGTSLAGLEKSDDTEGSGTARRRVLVVLSDGADTSSKATLDDAAGEALKANAPVFSVSIQDRVAGLPRDLSRLSNGTDGELHAVTSTRDLDAVFADLGRRILQPYWIEYRSSAPNRSQATVAIALRAGGRPAKARYRAIPTAAADGPSASYVAPKAAHPDAPTVTLPDGALGVLIVVAPFGALVFFLTWSWLQRRSKPDVLARIERYTRLATQDDPEARAAEKGSLLLRLAAPLLRIGERLLGGSSYFAGIRFRAEQAAIAIKPAELFAAGVAAGIGGGILALLVSHSLIGALIGGVVLGAIPDLWLRRKARKRRKKFENQLADVLGGIASSLSAGHSFNQAIMAMVKDTPAPTSEEFARVMTEARLGMPIEEALQHMADRMGSDDFEFAVTTVNIQRTVGGSLAEILEMVGDTVRNRQQFRKKVKALAAMGQMSAYVLLAMPIFIGGVITLMSPDYMAPLFYTSTGHMLLMAGAVSMALGYVTCMKIVNVKV